jgi:hypothetical protein
MKEYTFLLENSFRTPHVKARNIREALQYNRAFRKSMVGLYQVANDGDMVMSGWKTSNQIRKEEPHVCKKMFR